MLDDDQCWGSDLLIQMRRRQGARYLVVIHARDQPSVIVMKELMGRSVSLMSHPKSSLFREWPHRHTVDEGLVRMETTFPFALVP